MHKTLDTRIQSKYKIQIIIKSEKFRKDLDSLTLITDKKNQLSVIFLLDFLKRLPESLTSLQLEGFNLSKLPEPTLLKILATIPNSLTHLNLNTTDLLYSTKESDKTIRFLSSLPDKIQFLYINGAHYNSIDLLWTDILLIKFFDLNLKLVTKLNTPFSTQNISLLATKNIKLPIEINPMHLNRIIHVLEQMNYSYKQICGLLLFAHKNSIKKLHDTALEEKITHDAINFIVTDTSNSLKKSTDNSQPFFNTLLFNIRKKSQTDSVLDKLNSFDLELNSNFTCTTTLQTEQVKIPLPKYHCFITRHNKLGLFKYKPDSNELENDNCKLNNNLKLK